MCVGGFKSSKNINPNVIVLYFILYPPQHSIDDDDCFPNSNVAKHCHVDNFSFYLFWTTSYTKLVSILMCRCTT